MEPDRWGAAPVGPGPGGALVVGVVGARGGAGASTLAALVATRASERTATALVDLDPVAGGLDVLLGLEDDPGVRWPDLAAARGALDGDELLALLPRRDRCAVLSAGRSAGLPDDAVVGAALEALAGVLGLVVLDLGRAEAPARAGLCDVLVALVPADLRGVAGALVLRDAAPDADLRLVVRGPAPGGLGVGEVVRAVGRPLAGRVRSARGVARAAERAVLPRRGDPVRVADRLLASWGVR
ncbi:septum site-determining protein Ssd [Cellulomonas endophytica]|uniref:septum site-determining protein Ssd n=1 Tax=Cellulomonas endophytica TaxID=2494735 RepID=UPI00196B9E5E|nr:septum site-determining protein Ssd [Cellulomonas endophytica]